MKRSPLQRRTPLRAKTPLRSDSRSYTPRKRTAISPASKAQREAVRDRACLVCARTPVEPMHVVDRSLGGCDSPLCVVPACRECHRAYDNGELDLVPYLEPRFRDEQAHAVSHLGLARAYWRLTNERVAA
jgi:hypothetical protein